MVLLPAGDNISLAVKSTLLRASSTGLYRVQGVWPGTLYGLPCHLHMLQHNRDGASGQISKAFEKLHHRGRNGCSGTAPICLFSCWILDSTEMIQDVPISSNWGYLGTKSNWSLDGAHWEWTLCHIQQILRFLEVSPVKTLENTPGN